MMVDHAKPTEIYEDSTFFGQYTRFTDEKQRLANLLSSRMKGTDICHLLDLGCFDGEFSRRLVDRLQACGGAVKTFTGVEPAKEPIECFAQARESMGCELILKNATMEEFLATAAPKKYSWAVASHSLYWLRSPDQVLSQISKVADRSVIVIRDPGVLHELEVTFRPAMLQDGKVFFSSKEIAQSLTKLGIPFTQESFSAEFAVPPIDKPEFANLVGFLLDLKVEQLDTSLFPEIYRSLKVRDGKAHFNNDVIYLGGS